MKSLKCILSLILLLISIQLIAAETLNKRELINKLHFSDIKTHMLDKTNITPKQSKMLVAKPNSIFSMALDLEHVRNIAVTAIEFENQEQAAEMDKKPINGFHALNWFFIGIVDNNSIKEIIKAIER